MSCLKIHPKCYRVEEKSMVVAVAARSSNISSDAKKRLWMCFKIQTDFLFFSFLSSFLSSFPETQIPTYTVEYKI